MDFISQRRREQQLFVQSLAGFIEGQAQESRLKRGLIALVILWSCPILLQPYLGLNITRRPFVALIANLVFMVGGRVFRFKFVQTIAEIVEQMQLFVVMRSERREVLRLLFEELMHPVFTQIEEAFVTEAEREAGASGSPPPPTITHLFTPEESQAISMWTLMMQTYRFWWEEEGDEEEPPA